MNKQINFYLSKIANNSSIVFTAFILAIMGVILCPVPSQLLDFLFSISLTISILILVNVLFIKKSLSFNSFPSLLLITTMLRLSLNIASTRLILAKGHLGTSVAGQIIESFGNFVMQGSLVIGLIVFSIITIINFIVITKGSERIAEVSARFSLDAMPGKQMSIDADLAAGIIDDITAKNRRAEVESESVFFGAMDGASKFVRGDAIAGILIIFINFIGGILIGIFQQKISFSNAVSTYTLLTVGDGLIGQMPSLTISIAAGLLVTKSGNNESTDHDIIKQLANNTQILIIVSIILLGIGIIPGMPFITFAITAIIIATIAYFITNDTNKEQLQSEDSTSSKTTNKDDELQQINNALMIDEIKIEIGLSLFALIKELKENIKNMRLQIANELGFVVPYIRVVDSMSILDNEYHIYIKDYLCGKNKIYPNKIMVMNPVDDNIKIDGIEAKDPSFGINVKWCDENMRSECSMMDYTTIDPPIVLITHLHEIIKNNFKHILNHNTVKNLLSLANQETKKIIDEFIPSKISISLLKDVLYSLLSEDLSIKDLGTIIESISEIIDKNNNLDDIVNYVRKKLSLQITSKYVDDTGKINVISLSMKYEREINNAVTKNIPLSPQLINDMVNKINEFYNKAAKDKNQIVFLVSDTTRYYLQNILRQFKIRTPVISNSEINIENHEINILQNI